MWYLPHLPLKTVAFPVDFPHPQDPALLADLEQVGFSPAEAKEMIRCMAHDTTQRLDDGSGVKQNCWVPKKGVLFWELCRTFMYFFLLKLNL